MADFVFLNTAREAESELPLFKMYAWDFGANEFARDKFGHKILLAGDAALKIWIEKMLRTERFAHLAYSWRFGFERDLLGKVIGVAERRSELKRLLTEALLVNPYIRAVDKIEIAERNFGNAVEVTVELSTVYGKVVI